MTHWQSFSIIFKLAYASRMKSYDNAVRIKKTVLKKTVAAFTLACSLTTIMSISQTQAADTIDISFQNILQQERSWAGLQSKSLKVGDITWSYSEGGSTTKPTLLLIHGLGGVVITGTVSLVI